MPRHSPVSLGRLVARMAMIAPARYREIVRGMVAELDAIADPVERTRFALGAVSAIARLALSGYHPATVHGPGPFVGVREADDPTHGGPPMSAPTSWPLLRRHAVPFGVSLASLTALLLTNQAVRQMPELRAKGVPTGWIVEVLLLALPSTLALTIPMATFLAVSWVFTRLGAEGVLTAARNTRYGVRRLMAPVLGAAAVIATMTLVSNTQIVPRTNARLQTVVTGAPWQPNDRTMTIGELRVAAQVARTGAGVNAGARVAAYQVEIQKKFALAAACVLLALAGATTVMRFPRGGWRLVLGASSVIFVGYYLSIVAGEMLADRQVISPLVGMWMANVLLLAFVLLLPRRPRRPGPTHEAETLAIGG